MWKEEKTVEYSVISETEENEIIEKVTDSFEQAYEYIAENYDELSQRLNYWIEESNEGNLVKIYSKQEIESKKQEDIEKDIEKISEELDENVPKEDFAENSLSEEKISLTEEGYHIFELVDGSEDKYVITKEKLSEAIEYMDFNCLIDDNHYISYIDLTGNEVERYDRKKIEKAKFIDEDLEKTVQGTLDILNQPLQQQRRNDDDMSLQQILAEVLVNEKKERSKVQTISIQGISDIAEIHSMAEIVGKTLEELNSSDASIQMAIHCNNRCIALAKTILEKNGINEHEDESAFSIAKMIMN